MTFLPSHKIYDRLLKKEQISKLETINSDYDQFGYNVVRRPYGQCLGNLKYFNLNYDIKTGRFFAKDRKLKTSSNFLISDYYKDRVRCFITWNFGYGRYFPYKDFEEAMMYDYYRFGRGSMPALESIRKAEERCVRYYVQSQISLLRNDGYKAYRANFMKERPELFINEDRTVFRCIDNSLGRDAKIAACHQHKRDLKEYILEGFARRVMRFPGTVGTWFSERVDNEGYTRICFSEKAIDHINNRLKKNGLKPLSPITLFNMFCRVIKKKFGGKNYTIRTFIASCLMCADTEEVLNRSEKKVTSQKVLGIIREPGFFIVKGRM